jgi:hypothetical protein
MEALAGAGAFRPPTLDDIERSLTIAMEHAGTRGRLFADLWDIERVAHCPDCAGARRDRLHAMNLAQRAFPPVSCSALAHA